MDHHDESLEKQHAAPSKWFRRLCRVAYWSGRLCQAVGLLLLWWMLLIFPAAEDIRTLLYGGVAAAAAVFYLGWLLIRWAVKAA